MKKKALLKILCLWILLAFVVVSPLLITQIQYFAPYPASFFPVEADFLPVYEQPNLNVWQKLALSQKAMVVHRMEIPDDTSAEGMRHLLEDQLRQLQSCHALPPLSFSGLLQTSFSKWIYMDTTDPETANTLVIYSIQADYQNLSVCGFMDAQTSALYDITVTLKKSEFLYPTDVSQTGFLTYLLTFSEFDKESNNGELYSAFGYYGKSSIRLYVMSLNPNTSAMTFYRFYQSAPPENPSFEIVTSSSGSGYPFCEKEK